MPFDKNSVKGAKGISVGVKALYSPIPGLLGFSAGSRETIDIPGILGVSVSLSGNALINLRLTNFNSISQPLTIAISWSGHAAEVYTFDASFVTQRDFPINTLLTFQTSGPAYVTTTTTVTLTSYFPTAVDVLVAIVLSTNAYRRRRYL